MYIITLLLGVVSYFLVKYLDSQSKKNKIFFDSVTQLNLSIQELNNQLKINANDHSVLTTTITKLDSNNDKEHDYIKGSIAEVDRKVNDLDKSLTGLRFKTSTDIELMKASINNNANSNHGNHIE